MPRLLVRLDRVALRAEPRRLLCQRLTLALSRRYRRAKLGLLLSLALDLARHLLVRQLIDLVLLLSRLQLGERGLQHLMLLMRLLEPALELTEDGGGALLAQRHAALDRVAPLRQLEQPAHRAELLVHRRGVEQRAAAADGGVGKVGQRVA